jgi:hypothetical protein
VNAVTQFLKIWICCQGSHFWGNFPKTGKLADFWGAIWGIAFFGEIFGEFFEILVKLDGSTWNLCFNCFCLVLCTFGSTCVENDK